MDAKIIFIVQLVFISMVAIFVFSQYFYLLFSKKHKDFSWQYDSLDRAKSRYFSLTLMLFAELSAMGLLLTSKNRILTSTGEEDLSVKIEEIAKELSESSHALLDMQTELENRISTVEELKKEAEIAENMVSLTEEQVAAIQSKLNQELEASNGKSLLYNILISAVFFILGWIAQPIYNFFKKKPTALPPQNNSINGNYTIEEIEQAIKNVREERRKQIKDSNTP